mgnify:CR=1 FL=1
MSDHNGCKSEQVQTRGTQAWSAEEQAILLDAISTSFSLAGIIESVSQKPGRSRQSIERRLRKMGFLHTSGQTFRGAQGFVR